MCAWVYIYIPVRGCVITWKAEADQETGGRERERDRKQRCDRRDPGMHQQTQWRTVRLMAARIIAYLPIRLNGYLLGLYVYQVPQHTLCLDMLCIIYVSQTLSPFFRQCTKFAIARAKRQQNTETFDKTCPQMLIV